MVEYHVSPLNAHRFFVRAQLSVKAGRVAFYLPIWIPGSYTRRDFSRHLSSMRAHVNGDDLSIHMLDLSQWEVCVPQDGVLTVEYEVYARDYSVRGCYLDDMRGIFNPCCACVAFDDYQEVPHRIYWHSDEQRKDWQMVGMATDTPNQWQVDNYQVLVDSPLMMAKDMLCETVMVGDIPHTIAICGHDHYLFDFKRLCADVQKTSSKAYQMMGRFPAISHYTFMLFLTENVYGGLEHHQSTLLMSPRKSLPRTGHYGASYTQLLGLFSHEHFHLWNVKDMRAITYRKGYDLKKEQPSDMLWLFEGFTAYFDNLLLVRAKVISVDEYLRLLSFDMSHYLQREGRMVQNLSNASLEAWTKYYGGDEHAMNTSTNYYVHGALAAWCMDVFIAEHSADRSSLAQIMPLLWEDERVKTQGLNEAEFSRIVKTQLLEQAHASWDHLLFTLLHTQELLPLAQTVSKIGLKARFLSAAHLNDNGDKITQSSQRAVSDPNFYLRYVGGKWLVHRLQSDSAAAKAGLAVGDEIISVNHRAVSEATLWEILFLSEPHTQVCLRIMRDGLEREYQWHLAPAKENIAQLFLAEDVDSAIQQRREKWLNH